MAALLRQPVTPPDGAQRRYIERVASTGRHTGRRKGGRRP